MAETVAVVCHTYDNNLVILLEEILFASSEGGFPPGWLGYEAVVGGYIRGGLANRLQHFEPVLFTSNNTLFHENKDHAVGPVVVGPPLPRLPPRPRQGQDGMHTVAHRIGSIKFLRDGIRWASIFFCSLCTFSAFVYSAGL